MLARRGEGGIRIRAETYIQQDTEQRTAVLTTLVHARQREPTMCLRLSSPGGIDCLSFLLHINYCALVDASSST